jgi:hypothetical protein
MYKACRVTLSVLACLLEEKCVSSLKSYLLCSYYEIAEKTGRGRVFNTLISYFGDPESNYSYFILYFYVFHQNWNWNSYCPPAAVQIFSDAFSAVGPYFDFASILIYFGHKIKILTNKNKEREQFKSIQHWRYEEKNESSN